VDDPGFYVALGGAIEEMRLEMRVDRRTLASSAGVSYTYLSELEKGKKRMSARALLLVSRALGVRPYQLLERAEEMTAGGEVARRRSLRPSLIEEIDATLKRLSVHDLDTMLSLARRLARG
jgi:transcriptional regulator with XRE-family HTH domain